MTVPVVRWKMRHRPSMIARKFELRAAFKKPRLLAFRSTIRVRIWIASQQEMTSTALSCCIADHIFDANSRSVLTIGAIIPIPSGDFVAISDHCVKG